MMQQNLLQKNAGLSEKAFAAAQEAGKKLAEKGTMFGKKSWTSRQQRPQQDQR